MIFFSLGVFELSFDFLLSTSTAARQRRKEKSRLASLPSHFFSFFLLLFLFNNANRPLLLRSLTSSTPLSRPPRQPPPASAAPSAAAPPRPTLCTQPTAPSTARPRSTSLLPRCRPTSRVSEVEREREGREKEKTKHFRALKKQPLFSSFFFFFPLFQILTFFIITGPGFSLTFSLGNCSLAINPG